MDHCRDSRYGLPASLQLSAPGGAHAVLKSLVPHVDGEILGRLDAQGITTAVQLALLDKDDLRELGVARMADRSRIMCWAREALAHARGADHDCRDASDVSLLVAATATSAHPAPVVCGSQMDHASFWRGLVVGMPAVGKDCCGWVQFPASIQGADFRDVREKILERHVDLTAEHVCDVFHRICQGEAGLATVEQLGLGLRAWFPSLDDAVPEQIIEQMQGRPVDLPHFEFILTRLTLAQILFYQQKQVEAASRWLTIMDYSASKAETWAKGFHDYFFGHRRLVERGDGHVVRWVHLSSQGPDVPEIPLFMALMVKYRLHPLAFEDVMCQCPTKVDRYSDHYLATVEQLALISPCELPSLTLSAETSARTPSRVLVWGSHVSIFYMPDIDTVVTFSQPDNDFSEIWPGASSSEVPPGAMIADWWVKKIKKHINRPSSRLRNKRASHLMVQVIDVCADQLRDIAHAYMARLGHLEEELQQQRSGERQIRDKIAWMKEMSDVRLQLMVLMRRTRELNRALRQIDGPEFRSELVSYLRDVGHHLDEAHDDAASLVEKCGAILALYERDHESNEERLRQIQAVRLNNMLFVLTVATAVFAPVQLLAGVYGMNFVDPDTSRPTMPELTWPDGYWYFWCVVGVYLAVCFCLSIWLYRSHATKVQQIAGCCAPAVGRTIWALRRSVPVEPDSRRASDIGIRADSADVALVDAARTPVFDQ